MNFTDWTSGEPIEKEWAMIRGVRHRDIEERTYRLTRRRGVYNYPRGGLAWSGVRMSIALHDLQRAIERELLLPVLVLVSRAIGDGKTEP